MSNDAKKSVELTLVPKDDEAVVDPATLVTNLPVANDVPPLVDLVQQARDAGLEVAVDDTAARPGTVEELASVVDQLDKAIAAQNAAPPSRGDDMAKTLADLDPGLMAFLKDNGADVQAERDKENERLKGLREAEVNIMRELKESLSEQQYEAIPMSMFFFQRMVQLRSTLRQLVESGTLAGLASEVLVQEIAGINDLVNQYVGSTIVRMVTNGFTWMSAEDYQTNVQSKINMMLQIKADVFNAIHDDGKRVGNAVRKASANAASKQTLANAANVAVDNVPRTAGGDPIQ